MARGFESKDVEFQQAEAERRTTIAAPVQSAAERERTAARRTIELALADVRQRREAARAAAHQRMLDEAIADLERQLSALHVQG